MPQHAARPVACENCGTTLGGDYCHACGQAAHSPVRSFGHAVEEVFESFWHLDGKIFRTLRELLVPGQVASAYLAGRRVPYVAPMRLFVVLSVLTFFVARLAVHVEARSEAGAVVATSSVAGAAGDFAKARTPEEVEALRRAMTDEFVRTRDTLPAGMTGPRKGIDAALRATDAVADRRLQELRDGTTTRMGTGDDLARLVTIQGRPWDPVDNPIDVPWIPGVVDRWFNARLLRAQENLPRLQQNPQLFFNAFFAAVPSALFVMVPLFALLLRVFYLRSGRLYLEHLVVALYSHAFLCLDLLAILLLMLLGDALAGAGLWASIPLTLLQTLLWLWMPLYLLLMQRRTYGQPWLATAAKYALLGAVYGASVFWVAIALLIFSFTSV